jgi:CBS domain-containing protein
MADQQVVSRTDTVADVMTTWVVSVTPSASLLNARNLMTRNRVSQLVVVDERDRPTCLISKRDIARFLLEDTTTRALDNMIVSEASCEPIRALRPDLPVLNAARMFDTENLVYAIIEQDDKPVAGIMTETDLCHYFARKFPGKFKVDEFMTRDFVFAKSSYPIVHVAHDIVFRQPCVPVIDEGLVGVVTLSDLLSIRERTPLRRFILGSNAGDDTALITTKDLMTQDPVTTRDDVDLAQAAQIIINKGISSLPVIGGTSRVIGLITKHDIVRALGRVGRSLTLEA